MRRLVLWLLATVLVGCSHTPTPPKRRVTQYVPVPPPTPVETPPTPLRWSHPSLVVFFDRESSAPQIEQRMLLRSGRHELARRGIDVLFAWERVEDLDGRPTGERSALELRKALKASPLGFGVMLVDAQGVVRFQASEPMNPATVVHLFEAISPTK